MSGYSDEKDAKALITEVTGDKEKSKVQSFLRVPLCTRGQRFETERRGKPRLYHEALLSQIFLPTQSSIRASALFRLSSELATLKRR